MVNPPAPLPSPSPEHRRVAAGMFDRANQVVATGNFDYGIRLLLDCCKFDPANLLYRQALRRTEKAKYRNNLRGGWFAWLTAWPARLRLKAVLGQRDYLKALELGERVLMCNPWDLGAQLALAEAAEGLGLLDLAIWALEQARQRQGRSAPLNRVLARLYERRGNFTQAMALWDLVQQVDPADTEATKKRKDLAAHETIARGQYEEALGEEEAQGPGAAAATLPPAVRGEEGPLARETAALRGRLAADPTSAELHLQLARLYRKADQFEAARAVLQDGLGPTGNAFALMEEMADLDVEPFRRNLAIAEAKLKEAPDDGLLRKVRIQLRKEVNTRELDLFRQRADRHPTNLNYRYELGVRLLRAGQLDEAIRELQSARADARLRWQSLLYLGYCFKARNNGRLALRNFEEALQHLPAQEVANRKELLFELAQGHAEAGELAKAIDCGHELANLDFSYREIHHLLDEWEARLRQDVAP